MGLLSTTYNALIYKTVFVLNLLSFEKNGPAGAQVSIFLYTPQIILTNWPAPHHPLHPPCDGSQRKIQHGFLLIDYDVPLSFSRDGCLLGVFFAYF